MHPIEDDDIMIGRGDGMKILYKQRENSGARGLQNYGVQNCHLKNLFQERDRNNITSKPHRHAEFEMHLVTEGYQEYEIGGKRYKVEKGNFLLVYPNVMHTVVSVSPDVTKFSLAFNKQSESSVDCFIGEISDRMAGNMDFIARESLNKKEISATLIENCILEILVLVFRMSGQKENPTDLISEENETISIAKSYIEDNIEMAPSVADVAAYCYLSLKQFTRVFSKAEGITPGRYIIDRRIKRIEELLADRSLSQKQISSIMHFDNEYYFNTFFKTHTGTPPGEYRKMYSE